MSTATGGRSRLLLSAGGCVALLLAAVLLTRGGTAATQADLAPPAPVPTTTTEPGPTDSSDRLVMEADGISSARLGDDVSSPGGADDWFASGQLSVGGQCELMYPALNNPVAQFEVLGWQHDGRIVAVVAAAFDGRPTGPALATSLGPGFGDGLERAALLAGADPATERLETSLVGEIRTVTVGGTGDVMVFSDLGGDDGISYVEVRTPAGEQCVLDGWESFIGTVDRPGADGPPAADDAGRGDIRIGQDVEELVGAGRLSPGNVGDVRLAGCMSYVRQYQVGEDDLIDGLSSVHVRDGLVHGLSFWAGSTAEGLTVGDPEEDVGQVYPELAGLDLEALEQDALQLADGRVLLLSLGRGRVPAGTVDAYLEAGSYSVQSLTVLAGPCRG